MADSFPKKSNKSDGSHQKSDQKNCPGASGAVSLMDNEYCYI